MKTISNKGARATQWLLKGERAWVVAEWIGVVCIAAFACSWAVGSWGSEGLSLDLGLCSNKHASPEKNIGQNFWCSLADLAREGGSGPSDIPSVDFFKRH
jgi:hypothetical protein